MVEFVRLSVPELVTLTESLLARVGDNVLNVPSSQRQHLRRYCHRSMNC